MSSHLSLRLLGSVAALALAACVDDVDPTPTDVSQAGASGGGGSTSTGSAGSGGGTGTNTGGSGGGGSYQSDPSFGMGTPCGAVAQALLTDFTPAAAAGGADAGADAGATDASVPAAPATGTSFGDYTNTFSGATFVYPGTGMYPVTSDVSGGNWHITGSLGDYSGFGVAFQIIPAGSAEATACFVDASAYTGLSFTVSGSVPMGNQITLNVGTAADDVSHVWLNANTNPATPVAPNVGTCLPQSANQYDGSCGSPNFVVPVTAEPTTINVTWAQLTGGRPAASVDPTKLTGISWNFPAPAGAGTATPVPFAVDITIDNLRFLGP